MGNDDALVAQIVGAGARAGEALWPLPIPDGDAGQGRDDSKVADLMQHNIDTWGGALYAAAFLQRVRRRAPGGPTSTSPAPAFNSRAPYGHVPSGGTGFAVATLVELAAELSAATASGSSCRRVLPASSRRLYSRIRCGVADHRRVVRRDTVPVGERCAHSTDGTRRRVHSPSWATSSSVTSLTAVRGSTNPSTPRRVVANSRRCASSAASDARTVVPAPDRPGRRIRVPPRRRSRSFQPMAPVCPVRLRFR